MLDCSQFLMVMVADVTDYLSYDMLNFIYGEVIMKSKSFVCFGVSSNDR